MRKNKPKSLFLPVLFSIIIWPVLAFVFIAGVTASQIDPNTLTQSFSVSWQRLTSSVPNIAKPTIPPKPAYPSPQTPIPSTPTSPNPTSLPQNLKSISIYQLSASESAKVSAALLPWHGFDTAWVTSSAYLYANGPTLRSISFDHKSQDIFETKTPNSFINRLYYHNGGIYVSVQDYDNKQDSIVWLDTQGNIVNTYGPVEGYPEYGSSRVIHVSPNYIIIKTFAGDGCGAWGKIWKLTLGQEPQLISKIGAGCGKEPRFIGYSPETQEVILATLQDPENIPPDEYHLDKIIGINTDTLESRDIIKLSDFLDAFNQYVINPQGTQVLILAQDQLTSINLQTNQIQETYTADLGQGIRDLTWSQTGIYALNYDNTVYFLDPDSKQANQLGGKLEGHAEAFINTQNQIYVWTW